MRILDENDNELNEEDLDYSLGYLESETLTIAEHEAIEAVEEEGHYEVVAEYPNGGKDIAWVVDVEGVQAQDAWMETETIQRWHAYTEEELEEMRIAKEEAQANSTEAKILELQIALLDLAEALFGDEE